MLVTPITSKTARMAPPALMPLPSAAGFIITRVAPWRPSTSWWMVPLLSATFTMLRRACSIAFCTATGTSRALPLPMPTEPSPSPTTVRAAKPRIRPPFTTLVTRLTEIIFSRRPSVRSSCWSRLPPLPPSGFAIVRSSELETALTGGVGERFHAAVVAESRAVERDFRHAGGLRLLGDARAHEGCGGLVGAVGMLRTHVFFERGGGGKDLAARRVDDLRVDVQVRAMHGEAHGFLARNAHARLGGAALPRGFLVEHGVSPLLLLGLFKGDLLVGVSNALALVRLGALVRADLGGNLAHLLAISARDHDLGLRRGHGLHAFGQRVHDRVREAEVQVDLRALDLRLV